MRGHIGHPGGQTQEDMAGKYPELATVFVASEMLTGRMSRDLLKGGCAKDILLREAWCRSHDGIIQEDTSKAPICEGEGGEEEVAG